MTAMGYIVIRSRIYSICVNRRNAIDEYIYMHYICGMEEWKYIDDEWVADLVEEARLYEGVNNLDTSWYKGEGWYDEFLRKVNGEA